ncbi:MAG TPA: ABC transporter permease [Gemmatimonadaceae bacterium]|nr:ABC transporter permease [Gemmatimonadaceae bacterium]
MARIRDAWRLFTGLFRRRLMEERLASERSFHIEMATKRHVNAGKSPEEARRLALLEFGPRERFAEEARDEYRSRWMEEVGQDVRYAFRNLRHSPTFTLTAVLTLVLSIGATTAMFSVVNAVLLRRLPYPQPDRIAVLCELNNENRAQRPCNSLNPGNVMYWQRTSKAFATIGAMREARVSLVPPNADAVSVLARAANATVFKIMGARAATGRLFDVVDDTGSGANVVVLSHAFWRSQFGGDSAVVGTTVRLNTFSYTVVGVAAPDATIFDPVDIWLPLRFQPQQLNQPGRSLRGIGRLRDGVSMAQADDEMRAMAAQRAELAPNVNTNWTAYALPLHERLVGGTRRALWVLLGAVGFLLLIACANVANLQMVRAASRQREFALRISLGASPGRVVRQLVTESIVLTGVSTVLGLFLAVKGTTALVSLLPAGISAQALHGVTANGTVLAFSLLVAVGTGVLFGVAPAWQATRSDMQAGLKDGGRGTAGASRTSARLRSALVVAEISLAVMLLAGAGLMVRSLSALQRVRLGFDPAHSLTASMTIPRAVYRTDTAVVNFFRNAEARVRALPGVEAVGAISYMPLSGERSASGFNVEGRPPAPAGSEPVGDMRAVTPGYFDAMGVTIVAGRGFTEHDDIGSPKVGVISETLAHSLFPGENPVGRFLVYEWNVLERVEIVGVAADVHHEAVDKQPFMEIYRPLTQFVYGSMYLVVRASGDPGAIVAPLRAAIRAVDPNVPLARVNTMNELVAQSLGRTRLSTTLFALFGGLGLVLAAVGIYGVMAHTVQQRRHEVGVRMALGANRGMVRALFVKRGVGLALAGVVIGTAGGLLATRLMTKFLFGVSPGDPRTFALTAGVLGAVALVACYLPARAATNVSPVSALRGE